MTDGFSLANSVGHNGKRVSLRVGVVSLLEVGLIGADGADGLMQVHIGLCHIQHAARDVGAVVGYTLKVGQNIRKDKAKLDAAKALLQADGVTQLDLITQIVDQLLQRLDRGSRVEIGMNEGALGDDQDFVDGLFEHSHLGESGGREGNILLADLFRGLR